MLIINNKWSWYLAVFVMQLCVNAQASSLCANGNDNSAIVATTPTADFSDNGDGTVTHHKTGLMWQRCSLGQSWDGTHCTGEATVFTWADALAAAVQNTFAGLSDWRLPNKNELASIVEYRCHIPAINNQLFPATISDNGYWSSSPSARNSDGAWVVIFNLGFANVNVRTYGHHVRLVRAGQ